MSNKIENSIMSTLSRNSHELFHSNLWVWLIKNDPIFLEVFFDISGEYQIKKIEREKGNRDITIQIEEKNNSYYCIIENKFKSIPNMEQLKEYKNKFDKDLRELSIKNKYLLTYFIKPDFDIKKIGWKKKSYKNISKQLLVTIEKSKSKIIKKYKELLIEYCNYIEYIYKNVHDDRYFKDNIYDLELPIKYENDSIYKKFKAKKLIEYVKKQNEYKTISEKIDKTGFHLYANVGFFRGDAIVDFIIGMQNDYEKYSRIIIQLQGYKYKYLLGLHKNHTINEISKIFDNKLLITGYKKGNTIHNKKTSMKKPYCKYGKDIYQYWDIEKGLLYKEICENILNDINQIINFLSKKAVKKLLSEKKEKDE